MFSASTFCYEISHTDFKVIFFIAVINFWSKLLGEQRFSPLIRQQLISSQTACVPKHNTEAWESEPVHTLRSHTT